MKNCTRYLLALLLLLTSTTSFAQQDTAFWFAVPHITTSHAGRPIKLCVSTMGEAATVTVTQPARNNAQVANFTVPANSSHTVTLLENFNTPNFVCNPNQTSDLGLYIHSTSLINAYISVQANNSEIYALKGKNAYGTQFFIAMQSQYDNAGYSDPARNSVEVIATENNTTVTITPSVPLVGGRPANTPFTVTLNRGQVYCFASNSTAANSHLDRSIVTSNKPIVVDVTDDSASVPSGGQDIVADQIVPEELAGNEYIVVPSPSAANNLSSGNLNDYVFMFPLENGTDIFIYGDDDATPEASFTNVHRGDKRSYHFVNNNPVYINSTKPMFVFQVTGAGRELGGTLLPHIYCTGSTMASYAPLPHPSGTSHVKHIYWVFICKQNYTNGFEINGQTNLISASDWHPVPYASAYSYCCKEISSLNTTTSVRITNSLGNFHLGVIDYHQTGTNSYDDCSISYFSDYASSSKITWLTDSMDLDLCQGDTLFFVYDTVDANVLRVEGPNNLVAEEGLSYLSNIQPDQSGWFTVFAEDSRGCLVDVLMDSVWVDVFPSTVEEVRDTICFGAPYQGNGFTITEDRTQQAGEVCDTIRRQTVQHGCDSLVVLYLEVRDSVRTEFDQSACDKFVWNGVTYDVSGDWRQTFTDAHGCDSVVTMHLDVVSGTVQITQSTEDLCEDGYTTLTVESEFPDYVWSTGETTPSIEVTQSGSYSVTASDGDCEVRGVYVIDACPFNLFLPNTITPNNDGLNDYFKLPNPQDVGSCKVYIYNRVGSLIYFSDDVNFKWDGKENGKIRRNHTYNYLIQYTNQYGRILEAKGMILVL